VLSPAVKLRGLELGEPAALAIPPRSKHQPVLQILMRLTVLAPPTQGIGHQPDQHRGGGKVADHPEIIDGLGTEGKKWPFQPQHQKCCRIAT
jgi:hypothetical protein